MLRKATAGFILLAFAILNNLALAETVPTLHQIYEATQAGRLDEAQRMMNKVLQEHPNSSKAHYVEAEILAKQGMLSKADAELNYAERLEPGLPFAKAQAVQELKSRIAAAHPVAQPVGNGFQPNSGNNFPWGMLLLGIGAIVAIFLIIRAMNARNPANFPINQQPSGPNALGAPVQPYGAPPQPYGSAGIGQMAPAGGGIGSSIMGGLATGAAVGVGMVAGEALAHHFMEGNHTGNSTASSAPDSWGTSSDGVGGADFGIADNSSWEDNSSIAQNTDVGGDDWS